MYHDRHQTVIIPVAQPKQRKTLQNKMETLAHIPYRPPHTDAVTTEVLYTAPTTSLPPPPALYHVTDAPLHVQCPARYSNALLNLTRFTHIFITFPFPVMATHKTHVCLSSATNKFISTGSSTPARTSSSDTHPQRNAARF